MAFNFVLLQFLISVLCAVTLVAAMEKNPPTNANLASYECRYPKDLFNKMVVANGQAIGHVAKEADDLIVVFGDSDNSRFDVPESKVALAGGSVVVKEPLEQYAVGRDAPLPEGKALRPSGDEIRAAAAEQLEVKERKGTTPDVVMKEGRQLTTVPRPETTAVSTSEGYVDTESELSKKIGGALAELRKLIVAGTKVAKKKANEAQAQAAEKHAEMDAEAISKMGDLSMRFADSFEDVLSEIRARTYSDQDQIYTGFLKLMDTQREMVVARREFARRLKSSVGVPVVDKPQLGTPSALPEDIHESRARKSTGAKRK